MQVCIGNSSGVCMSDPDGGCFGCENGKPAKIYARYFSDETSVEVPEWNGYSCAQDNYLSRSCCFLWRDYGLNTPKVAVPKFVFNTTNFDLRILEDGVPAQGVEAYAIGVSGNRTVSKQCTSGKDGVCHISNLPPSGWYGIDTGQTVSIINATEGGMINIEIPKTLPMITWNITPFPQVGDIAVYSLSDSLRRNGWEDERCRKGLESSENGVPLYCFDLPTSGRNWTGADANQKQLSGHSATKSFDRVLVRIYADGALAYEGQFFMNESKDICIRNGKLCTSDCLSEGCPAGEYCALVSSPICCPLGTYSNGKTCLPREEKFQVFFVPVNFAPDDQKFLNAVSDYASFIGGELELQNTSFIIVNKTLKITKCPLVDQLLPKMVEDHFKSWYVSATGRNSKADADYTRYRVIGLDQNNVCNEASCGFAVKLFNSAAYLTGEPCSYSYHVAAHEMGHSFGLCDDYNPNLWDTENVLSLFSCKNDKPNETNSACRGCGLDEACCFGVRLGNGKFSSMGSSDLIDRGGRETGTALAPVEREFSDVCKKTMNAQIAEAGAK